MGYEQRELEAAWEALSHVSRLLEPLSPNWLVGGSCGLLLQGVPIGRPPRDIDIYVDEIHTAAAAFCLKEFATDQLQYNETDIYSSHLSHYELSGISVELVGGFVVRSMNSRYEVNVSARLSPVSEEAVIKQVKFHLMPLPHEFVFNVLRERMDRVQAIASRMGAEPDKYRPVLSSIIKENTISDEAKQVMKLALGDAGGAWAACW
ncbi:nucleotidyltransferase domain-containing protein [Paenibacillus gansuensis]|uniref:Nucleotidyltransferase domain-containing protein n=1 Tax=Paenibacillus gansuensis TaxID=306542 RepID=A0ABW5PC07_9BACL